MRKFEHAIAVTGGLFAIGLGCVAVGETITNDHIIGEQRCIIDAPRAEVKACNDTLESDAYGTFLKIAGGFIAGAGFLSMSKIPSKE